MSKNQYAEIEKRGDIAIVWLDQQGEKVNKISPELIDVFAKLFEEIEHDPSVKAAILISRKKDFIAGADIESFQKVQKPGDFAPITRRGHEGLSKIAASKKPVVAAIHGACLGAGLEISLACHARICADEGTTLALPEVQLGLLPGGGGTQRLPRLIGIQKALDMMLTGKTIYARPAFKMGLVDRITPKSELLNGAVSLVQELIKRPLVRKRKKTIVDILLEGNPIGRNIIFSKAAEMVTKQTQGNYPAPYKIIECVKTGINEGMKAGIEAEITKFEQLVLSPESRQLINIFFAMTEMKKNPLADKVKPVKRIAMLGAGFMGAGIAEVTAVKGIPVILKDIKDEFVANGKKTIWDNLFKKVKRKAIRRTEADTIIGRVWGQTDYSGFQHADIIIEAVLEDMKVKQSVLAECEAVTKDTCIFASNTSSLPITKIAQHAKRPENVIGMHYFSPVPKMPLLEIIVTDKTADWVTATCLELGIKQGKTCIVVKDGPGFYTTRILAPYTNEALLLLDEGADALQIDRALKKFGFPVGPITLLDEVGIDVGAHIMSGELTTEFAMKREGAKISFGIKRLYDAGFKGRKNKKGFYKYDEKGKKLSGQIDPEMYNHFGGSNRKKFDDLEIQQRMAMLMVNEAAQCLQEGILSSPRDGDIGAIFGLGFAPFTGGPFRYLDSLGAQKAVDIMNALKDKHGLRFKPAEIIVEKAKSGKKFYE